MKRRLRMLALLPLLFLGGCLEVTALGAAVTVASVAIGVPTLVVIGVVVEQDQGPSRDARDRGLAERAVQQAIDEIAAERVSSEQGAE